MLRVGRRRRPKDGLGWSSFAYTLHLNLYTVCSALKTPYTYTVFMKSLHHILDTHVKSDDKGKECTQNNEQKPRNTFTTHCTICKSLGGQLHATAHATSPGSISAVHDNKQGWVWPRGASWLVADMCDAGMCDAGV